MELILAFVLFVGLIIAWTMLPGTTTSQPAEAAIPSEPRATTANVSQTA